MVGDMDTQVDISAEVDVTAPSGPDVRLAYGAD